MQLLEPCKQRDTIDAATMADNGVIALTHSAGVDLQYDGVSLGLVSDVPTSAINVPASLAQGKNWGDADFSVAYLGEAKYIEDAATTKAVAVTYDANGTTLDTSDDEYVFTFSASATAGLDDLTDTDENGVIELTKVWKVTNTDVTVTVGTDEPTMTNGILVKDGETVTVSTVADAAGKCIAVNDVVDVAAGLSTDSAVVAKNYQVSENTDFTQLDGVKGITLTGVDALVDGTGSTEVEAVDVDSSGGDDAFATASDQAATRQAADEDTATDVADDSNEIAEGDEIVLTLTLTAADTDHTLAFLEEITLDSIADDSGYEINLAAVSGEDAWTVTITFTAGS